MSIYEEFKEIASKYSDALVTIKVQNGENEIEVDRNGKKEMLKEKWLWREIMELGPDCQAGKIMREKYGSVFELSELVDKKKEEIRVYELERYGCTINSMTFEDLERIIRFLALDEVKKQVDNMEAKKEEGVN